MNLIHNGAEDSKSHGWIEMAGTDLEYAKKEFEKRGSAFIIAKDRKILAESTKRGVAPFFFAVNGLHDQLEGTSLADKIVGKAVALLSAYSGIVSVYTPLVSIPAVGVLDEHHIRTEADRTVEMILNQNRTDQCPIEKLVLQCSSPEEAYAVLKRRFEG